MSAPFFVSSLRTTVQSFRGGQGPHVAAHTSSQADRGSPEHRRPSMHAWAPPYPSRSAPAKIAFDCRPAKVSFNKRVTRSHRAFPRTHSDHVKGPPRPCCLGPAPVQGNSFLIAQSWRRERHYCCATLPNASRSSPVCHLDNPACVRDRRGCRPRGTRARSRVRSYLRRSERRRSPSPLNRRWARMTQNPKTDTEGIRGKLGQESGTGDKDDAQEGSHGRADRGGTTASGGGSASG